MNLSNYRYNRLGGIDADRELESGEIVPYTLTGEEIAALPEGTQVAPYTEPPAPIPRSITRAQAIAALILSGLDEAVMPAIESIQDPVQRKLALNDYQNRLTFERDNATLQTLAAMLGLDDAQLDDLFRLAATL